MTDKIKRQQYSNPAVQEAIFEVRFENALLESVMPGLIFDKIEKEYPLKKDLPLPFILNIVPQEAPPPDKPPHYLIMQAKKQDESEAIQIGHGIVTANILKYSTWENFTKTIKTAVDAYVQIAKPKHVARISTRYINSFIFSSLPENLNIFDYFNLRISTPTELDMRVFDITLIHMPANIGKHAYTFEVKTRFSALPSSTEEIKLILDIECYLTTGSLAPETKYLISLAAQAHDFVEETFENIITQKTRDLMGVHK